MPLQPRNFRSKKIQKSRSLRFFKLKYFLKYGTIGLIIPRPIQFTGSSLSKLKLFLKRSSKKGDKTRRQMWLNAFPHLPLSKKPTGLRMGKGKGKLSCWFTNIRGGTVLVEFKNLRYGRALYFINQTQFKLGIPTIILKKSSTTLQLPLLFSKKKLITPKSFW